jgi:hypothetical protein
MKILIRKILSKYFRFSEFVLKRLVVITVRKLTFRSNHSLAVTFDSTRSADGTGAQLQRLLSVYALANYFGLNYVYSDIKQVSVHPLDPFQSDELYKEYLVQLNKFLDFEALADKEQSTTVFENYDLQFWRFMSLLIRNSIRNKALNLAVFEPYSVTEFNPEILGSARNSISIRSKGLNVPDKPYIVIHYRQGVGGFAIYPGQNIARETPLAHFERVLFSIIGGDKPNRFIKLFILTDAPAEVTHFRPPTNQQDLWEGTPGYSEGIMTIQPIRFDELEGNLGMPVEVIRGGNPLAAIEIMAHAELLLMGKSSLSYLGGYLNRKGAIYYPSHFWHRPLPGWKGF